MKRPDKEHFFIKILAGSINGQLSAQPTNEVAYVKFALDTETVLTSEEKELLPFFTHFFLSMGAGSKSYREMDTAMELHTGSMGASIHMYVTIRCLMVSTDQADSRCFYFRIS